MRPNAIHRPQSRTVVPAANISLNASAIMAAKMDEERRLSQFLEQMDSALQGLISAFEDAFAKMEKTH